MATALKVFVLERVYPLTLRYGYLSGCHRMESRSFFIGIRQFPVCARCTGMLFSAVFFLPVLFIVMTFRPPLYVALLLIIPLPIDGFVQLLSRYESTNPRRFVSGLLFGVGLQLAALALLFRVT